MMHTDAMIDHWGHVFEQQKLGRLLNIDFERFLGAPRRYLEAAKERLAADCEAAAERIGSGTFAPLLPAQAAVAARLNGEQGPAEMTAALERVAVGESTADDAELVRAALRQSHMGRRLLADCDSVFGRAARADGADADAAQSSRFSREERAARSLAPEIETYATERIRARAHSRERSRASSLPRRGDGVCAAARSAMAELHGGRNG